MRACAHVCVYTSTGIFIAISSARLYSDCQATVYRHLADSRAKRPDMDSREMARCFFFDENEKQRRESVLCPLKSDTSTLPSPPSLVGSWPVIPTNLDFRFFPFPSFLSSPSPFGFIIIAIKGGAIVFEYTQASTQYIFVFEIYSGPHDEFIWLKRVRYSFIKTLFLLIFY